ncbi:hypothetical protein NQ314_018021 [Rhamnusium bicolor]|uniref:Protein kinase domain-containing protein n=1 Tax=Rhamnusium bicolor TaxID=1586634 RepID=A0AAV8WSD3_9CUCU|nr:hypothetical protein NQ314_018021 [Rhamnusium bicolor]
MKTSISVVPEANENNIHYGKKNDSFDLDFSALTISTPVKEKENGNKALKVVKPDHTTKEQFEFVTPKVNNVVHKTQSSLTKKPCFRTPINSFNISTRKILTPSINIINKHPSPILIKDDLVHRNEEKHFSPVDNLRDDKFNIIKVNDIEYIILNMLGRGGSSEVFQCYNVDNQSHVAIKCVSLENSLTASSYINEVKLLHQLQKCDKIIKMHDYELLESQKKLLVVLEKGGEDLSTILKCLATQTSHIPMYMLLFYWMEMLYAVKQIHSYGVIHSDLKPSNFLKADGGLKLIDFGIASTVQTDMTSVIKTTAGGSCNYISPEALNNDSAASAGNQNSNNSRYKLHYKSDVWSLGCILYQFVYRRTPFQHISQLWPKLAAIMNPEHKIEYPEAQWVSPKIISTIKKMFAI